MSLQQQANIDGLRLLERLGRDTSGESESAADFGNAQYGTLDSNDSYFRDDNSKITHSLNENRLEEKMKRPKTTPLRHDNKSFPLDRAEARQQRVFGGHFDPYRYKEDMEEQNNLACSAPCSDTNVDEEEGEPPYLSPPPPPNVCPSKVTINISGGRETSINLLNDMANFTPPSFNILGEEGQIPMSLCPATPSTQKGSLGDTSMMSCHESSKYKTPPEASSCSGFDSSTFHTRISPGASMGPTPPPAMNVSMSLSPINATLLTAEPLSSDFGGTQSTAASLPSELLNMTHNLDMNESFLLQEEIRGYQKKRRQCLVMRTKKKNKRTQQVVIPKGMLLPWEAAVIEIPRRYLKDPVVIVKRRPGEVAQYRAASHFVSSGPPGVQNLRVIRGGKGRYRYDDDSDEENNEGTSSQRPSNASSGAQISSPQNSYYQVPPVYPAQPPFAPNYLPAQFQQAPPPQFQQAPPPQQFQAPPPQQFQQPPPLQSYPPQHFHQSYSPWQLPQTFSPTMTQHLQRQGFTGTTPQTNFKCVVCPSKLSESSGKYCVPPDAMNMQAEIDLSEKERIERDKLTRSLEEFQRSRRTFLGSSRAFTTKVSNISNISCDSSCSRLDFQ